jgi:hypothetical protein
MANGNGNGGSFFGELYTSVTSALNGNGNGNGGAWAAASEPAASTPAYGSGTQPQEQIVCEVVPGIGYTQCPPDYRVADPVLESMTSGTLSGALVRLISGWNPQRRTFSRTRKSAQISKDLELGWAHAATVGKTWMGRDVIRKMARDLPELSASAWGADFARGLASESFSNEVIDLFLKKTALPEDRRAFQLIQGWNAISQTAPGQKVYSQEWFRSKVRPMIAYMEKKGWRNRRTLAALVRMRNSGRQGMISSKADLGEEAAVEAGLDEYVAQKSSRANDVERIRNWPEFQGEIAQWPKWQDLRYQGAAGVSNYVPPSGQGAAPALPGEAPVTTPTQEPGRVAQNGQVRERSKLGLVALGGLALVGLAGGGYAVYKAWRG